MTTEEKIKVMQGYLDGKTIQRRINYHGYNWEDIKGDPSWDQHNYEFQIKSEYIPFDFSDAENLIGNIIRYKQTKSLSVITNVNPKNVTSSGTVIQYQDLIDKYEYTDGSICGKLKQ